MDDRDAFHHQIIATPADLTPRLVFADWLEENGDPLGEFIRVQCAVTETMQQHTAKAMPTHKCTICKALWVLWPNDQGWSLCSNFDNCGKCCDNAPMGQQIVGLTEHELELLQRQEALLQANYADWTATFPGFGTTFPGRDRYGTVINFNSADEGGGRGNSRSINVAFRSGFLEYAHVMLNDLFFWNQIGIALTAFGCGVFQAYPWRFIGVGSHRPGNVRYKGGRGSNSRRYAWFISETERSRGGRPGHRDTIATVPEQLMPVPGRRRCNYKTEREARAALSERIIVVGRQLVGLSKEA